MRRTRLLYCGDAHGNNAGDKQFQIKGNIYVRAVMSLIICDDFKQTISTVTIRAYSQKKEDDFDQSIRELISVDVGLPKTTGGYRLALSLCLRAVCSDEERRCRQSCTLVTDLSYSTVPMFAQIRRLQI